MTYLVSAITWNFFSVCVCKLVYKSKSLILSKTARCGILNKIFVKKKWKRKLIRLFSRSFNPSPATVTVSWLIYGRLLYTVYSIPSTCQRPPPFTVQGLTSLAVQRPPLPSLVQHCFYFVIFSFKLLFLRVIVPPPRQN